MKIREIIYALAVIILSYDVLSTLAFWRFRGQILDLNPLFRLLGQESIIYAWIVMIVIVVIFSFAFDSTLDLVQEKGPIDRILVMFCDFAAIIILAFEVIAIPHNTMCLLGSRGIILNQEMYSLQNIMTFLIAVVITLVVDWKRLLGRLE